MSERALQALEYFISSPSSSSSSSKQGNPAPKKPLTRHQSPIARALAHRTLKKKDPVVDSNPVIKYFRSISRRSLRPKNVVALDGETKYKPFDYDALVSRIATFQKVVHWDITNKTLTPLECSLKGWCCSQGKNEIHCECCGARLCFKFPDDDEEEELIEMLTNKYIEQLTTAHKPNCPWRKQSTPRSIYGITLANMDSIISAFLKRYEHNSSIPDLDTINIAPTLTPSELETITTWLESHGLIPHPKAIELSVLGWTVENHGTTKILHSDSDARRVLVSTEPINLLDEHHHWSAFQNYKELIKMFTALNPIAYTNTTPSTPCSAQEDVSGSYDDTMDRLDRMRKLYFD